MLVVERARALALKLNNPNRVLDSIPTARPYEVRGIPIVVTPHRIDEVKVLRNLGIKAPSPILHYYDWPGQFTPFDHQKQTAAFLTLQQRALVLNEIGTGKTQSALWAADYLIKTKHIKKVLILSPLSTLERVWGDAIF
jgi:superfamily II DNA or RNA helicase